MEDQEKITNLPQREGGEVDELDQEDAISLCDLLTDHYQESEYYSFHHESNEEDNSFEFSFSTNKNDDGVSDDSNNGNAINFFQQQVPDSPVYYRKNKRTGSNSATTGSHRYRNHGSNSGSRRHKVLIGLEKIPTEMELSDIKKRQSKRRNPAPMFPVIAGGGDGELAVGGDNGYGGRKNHRGLARLLRSGSQFASVLAKTAFGCFSLVRVCHY